MRIGWHQLTARPRRAGEVMVPPDKRYLDLRRTISIVSCRLKLHLCSYPQNCSALRTPSHVFVVLNHRLNQEWPTKQQDVEFYALLGLCCGGSRRELRANTVSHVA